MAEENLTLFAAEPPASRSQSQDSEKDWLTLVATWPLSFLELLAEHAPHGLCGRTSPASCRLTEDGRLEVSSGGWGNSGMGSPTECWTLNTLEFPSAAAACSLSAILETGDVPRRYFLSAKACQGILHRAAKRGKVLPPQLMHALQQAGSQEQTEPAEVTS